MGLFKRAHARGIAHELIRQGVVSFPSKEAADEAADAVADQMPEQPPAPGMPAAGPEVSGPEGHSPDEVAAIANKLIEIAQALMAQAGAGGPPAEAAAKMGAETLFKTASAVTSDDSYAEVASKAAVELMDKAAAETKAAGSLVQGGDKGNTPEQAATVTEIGELDQKQRPQGTYQVPQGDTAMKTMQGHIGSLENHDKKPGESPAGSNSLTEDPGKKASLREEIRKIAGSLIQGGDKGNTPAQAAQVTEIGKLDQKQRPEGYAHVGQGNANFSEPQAARVGLEQKHPETPSRTISGTNSVIQASKAAAEDPFMTLFKKTAAEVVPQLPVAMSDEQKVAAVRHMMGMDSDERATYIESVKSASEQAATTPAEAVAALKSEEGEKKEGSLLDEVKKIAAAAK